MMRPASLAVLAAALAASGCASPPPSPYVPSPLALPATEAVYVPDTVRPGQLSYAPDGSTFAPILTERFAFPTERQANDAYRRFAAAVSPPVPAASVRLFGCRPGAFDPRTVRVVRHSSPVVHCATDFLDRAGRSFGRVTVNFRHDGAVWRMDPVYPPRDPVPWAQREPSPRDRWSWLPGRDRYE